MCFKLKDLRLVFVLISFLGIVIVAQEAETHPPGTPTSDPTCMRIKDSLECLPIAPDNARVDLETPIFSEKSTSIIHPLYPVSTLHSVIMLGQVEGKAFRSETTLLPGSRIIEWNGQKIKTLVSQYIAYRDGRIDEVALDWYAQADDGSVWYLGEDVTDYEEGVMFTNEGTWLAGREGPAAMIMPANPQVGNVYRVENLPYIVFEEITITDINQTLYGPHGPIRGAIITTELNGAGDVSIKVLAPGYGEFRTSDSIDHETLALAVPTDALSGPVPKALETLPTTAINLFRAAQGEDWQAVSDAVVAMSLVRVSFQRGDIPQMLESELNKALVAVMGAVNSRDSVETQQAAIAVKRAALDLLLQYRPVIEIDLARFDLWTFQILVDVAHKDAGGVTSDITTMELVWDRVSHAFEASVAKQIRAHLENLRSAADNKDLRVASDEATQLHDFLAGL